MANENESESPMGQEGFAVNEAPIVIFFEVCKKVGEDDWAVAHTTIRDIDDDNAQKRFDRVIAGFENRGFTLKDAPKKMQYPPRGGGGNGQFKKHADVPEDGKFQVEAVSLFDYNNGKHLNIHGVNGEWVKNWSGKEFDAMLKTIDAKASQPFLNWAASWKEGEQHKIEWTTHKLIAQCEKSGKTDRNGKPYWNVKAFIVE